MGAGLIVEIISDSEERVGCGTGEEFVKKSILNYFAVLYTLHRHLSSVAATCFLCFAIPFTRSFRNVLRDKIFQNIVHFMWL